MDSNLLSCLTGPTRIGKSPHGRGGALATGSVSDPKTSSHNTLAKMVRSARVVSPMTLSQRGSTAGCVFLQWSGSTGLWVIKKLEEKRSGNGKLVWTRIPECATLPPLGSYGFEFAMVPMTSSAFRQFGNRILHRVVPWMALLACLVLLPGCAWQDLHGSSFAEDGWTTLPKGMRPVDDESTPTAYSNKARQIERNLGVQ